MMRSFDYARTPPEAPEGLGGFRWCVWWSMHHGADLCGKTLAVGVNGLLDGKIALSTRLNRRSLSRHKLTHEPSLNHFELLATDGAARTGRLTTPHGVVRTPAFMPVGTAGAMKGMHWREVRDAGADIVLGNTYHLMLRPGAERIAALGGLQNFTGWRRADADRFRRLPGDVAVGAAQGHREGGHLPLAYRRRQGRTVAGALDRGAAAARLRHRDADGRMRAAAGRARRYRARDAAVAALGASAASARSRAAPAGLHAVRHRAGRRRRRTCATPAPAA